MTCPHCGEQNQDDTAGCFHCGQPLQQVTAVRRGYDRTLDEEVALKVLRSEVARDADMARRFRQEIKLARKVRHANVCGIHEYGEDGDLRFTRRSRSPSRSRTVSTRSTRPASSTATSRRRTSWSTTAGGSG
jgi:serine/threonine protein kinase